MSKRDEFLAELFGLIEDEGSYTVTKQKAWGSGGGVLWTLSDSESMGIGDEGDDVCGVLELAPWDAKSGLWCIGFQEGGQVLFAKTPRAALCAMLGLAAYDN
jgi:hypothetical protein